MGWSFQTDPDACIASASAGRTRLLVAVRRNGPIRLSVALPAEAAGHPVAQFHGPAGQWTSAGFAGHHEIVFNLGHDMNALSRVLMLLSGGTLNLESPERNLPILDLAQSGNEGQQWFGCARNLVI